MSYSSILNLDNRVAIVTGGASGIGFEIAKALKGFDVLCNLADAGGIRQIPLKELDARVLRRLSSPFCWLTSTMTTRAPTSYSGKSLTSMLRFTTNEAVSADSFRDVLLRSTLDERRPVDDIIVFKG